MTAVGRESRLNDPDPFQVQKFNGGYEVGIIGGFEAVVGDDGSFSMLTSAS